MASQADPSPTLEPHSGLTLGLVIGPHSARSPRFAALSAELGDSGIQVRIITSPALSVPVSPGPDPRHPVSIARDLCVVPSPPDVVLVDLAATDGTDMLEAVQGCPELAGVPVVVHLENPDRFGVRQHLRWDVADFVSTGTSTDEVVRRLRVVAARKADATVVEEATDALRARVRSVSASLADNTETRDPRVLAAVFVRGLADAFEAGRVHLDLFEDERAGALTEQWPTQTAGLPAPGVAGSDAEPLAHHLWDAGWVGIFNTPSSQNSPDNESCKNRGNSEIDRDTGIDEDSQDMCEPSVHGLSEDPDCTPQCTVAVPLGDTARVSGLVQLISDTGPLPWSEVHTALIQHVAGNFVRSLRQVNLHARHTEAIERLAYLNFLKDDFVATINHEFRGPLATITGHLEMVADGFLGPIPESQRDTLDVLQRNTTRLNNLVENILTVSVLEQSRSQPAPVDLTDVVRTVVTGLQATAAAKAIVIMTDLPAAPVIVTGHRGQLEEALRNVLRNSLDFTTPAGSITVSVTPAQAGKPTPAQASDPDDIDGPGHVLIIVQDTGVGIPADDLPHLYTSFYRGSNIKRSTTTGSGLGLTITKQIIDRHQGTITIDSNHEAAGDSGTTTGGTTVSMTLPLPKP